MDLNDNIQKMYGTLYLDGSTVVLIMLLGNTFICHFYRNENDDHNVSKHVQTANRDRLNYEVKQDICLINCRAIMRCILGE